MDKNLVTFMADELGSFGALAEALEISRQTVWDWRVRGVSKLGKRALIALATERGIKLPRAYTKVSA